MSKGHGIKYSKADKRVKHPLPWAQILSKHRMQVMQMAFEARSKVQV